MAIALTAYAATFKTIYSFTGGGDGRKPVAGLVFASNGFLYGTTSAGGAHHRGTVFRINPVTGKLTTLHAFSGPDGETPLAGLVADRFGSLYGTTSAGGEKSQAAFVAPAGTIFKIGPTGRLTTLYTFSGWFCGFTCPTNPPPQDGDGGNPKSDLVLRAGALYGTGAQPNLVSSVGWVFKFSLKPPNLKILFNFVSDEGNWPFGALPLAGVAFDKAGNIYGTTLDGPATGGWRRRGISARAKTAHSRSCTALAPAAASTGDIRWAICCSWTVRFKARRLVRSSRSI